MATNTATFHHELLGKLTGVKVNHQVIQFLGVKYASVKERFADSVLFEQVVENATKFGPACPQVPDALQTEQERLIQKALPVAGDIPEQSDTECLNLNIVVPSDATAQTNLPVLVWIHGGGFLFGANFWPQTDMCKLVTLGIESEKPFIGVSINYRTNTFGFLTSSEMKQFGAHGNYGIKDQINAFLWIRKFIAGFGGDPENATTIGESCGGVSATLLLHNREALFRRVVSMGGHALLMPPISTEEADVAYEKVISSLGLDNLSAEERVQKLRTIPSEEMIEKVPRSIPNRPVIDGDIFRAAVSSTDVQDAGAVDRIPGKAWCEDLLIGDCQADGYIMSGGLVARKQQIARQFIQSLSKSLDHQPRLAGSILSDYQISEHDEDNEAFTKIVSLLTDVGFYAPTGIALQGWPRNKGRYLYHFNAPNPFPGPLQGKASHVLDVAFLFQNYNEYFSAAEVKVARGFALAIINFAHDGKPGWNTWSENSTGNFQVFGHTADEDTTFGTEGKSQRRPFVPRLLQEYSYETLWGTLQEFLRGE